MALLPRGRVSWGQHSRLEGGGGSRGVIVISGIVWVQPCPTSQPPASSSLSQHMGLLGAFHGQVCRGAGTCHLAQGTKVLGLLAWHNWGREKCPGRVWYCPVPQHALLSHLPGMLLLEGFKCHF